MITVGSECSSPAVAILFRNLSEVIHLLNRLLSSTTVEQRPDPMIYGNQRESRGFMTKSEAQMMATLISEVDHIKAWVPASAETVSDSKCALEKCWIAIIQNLFLCWKPRGDDILTRHIPFLRCIVNKHETQHTNNAYSIQINPVSQSSFSQKYISRLRDSQCT